MDCALVDVNGVVDNIIVADPAVDHVVGYKLVALPEFHDVSPNWVQNQKAFGGFKPSKALAIGFRQQFVSRTATELSVRLIFDYAGQSMPSHLHAEAHKLKIEAGSFSLIIGNQTSIKTVADGEIVLPSGQAHSFTANEDDSVVVNTFPEP